ncbi:MAG: enoyl-CoA hydratase-related protein [Tepidisphaeraceae bacterium]
MSAPGVLFEAVNPSVVVVTLNRAEKRNALNTGLMEELCAAVHNASTDTRCRALILRGNGPVFCAGLDLHEASLPEATERSARALAELYKAICLSPLVTIAAAQGAAMGGGVGLLAACDLVVASDDLRIGFPEVRRGLVAALVTALLRRQLPERVLRELVLLGQTITATDALSHGLVNRVVPSDRLTGETERLAGQVLQGAPAAITRTKSLLDDLAPRPIASDLVHALRYHLEARDDSEAAEGIAAFLQKREPRWLRP